MTTLSSNSNHGTACSNSTFNIKSIFDWPIVSHLELHSGALPVTQKYVSREKSSPREIIIALLQSPAIAIAIAKTVVMVVLFIFMADLCNRAGHYIFALWFLLLSFFLFPRLISTVAQWMSAILPCTVWP